MGLNLKTPTDQQLLWVIPEDLFRISDARHLERQLHELFACETWLLAGGEAIAVSLPEIRVDRGVPLDVSQFERLTLPFFDFLDNYLVRDYDSLNLNIPGSRYWTRTILESKETEKRHCMHIVSKLVSPSACRVRIYSTRLMDDDGAERARRFIVNWFENCNSAAIIEEVITHVPTNGQRYVIEPTEVSYPQDGFEFELRPFSPVTWPWLELYLAIRRSFPKRERLSIEFSEVP